ncbi:unnamed protein product [Callosobruchus maculatus]|uniref:Uncharacterized protein n=1 Tax=Callosobruchus maculatus TaxID=64391 RepID=A0A653DD65_CALMS|nr:unnamed protein product [Callosobruchus maculatus]
MWCHRHPVRRLYIRQHTSRFQRSINSNSYCGDVLKTSDNVIT